MKKFITALILATIALLSVAISVSAEKIVEGCQHSNADVNYVVSTTLISSNANNHTYQRTEVVNCNICGNNQFRTVENTESHSYVSVWTGEYTHYGTYDVLKFANKCSKCDYISSYEYRTQTCHGNCILPWGHSELEEY